MKEGFEIAIQRYSQTHSEEVIIIIDEFETVTNKTEIAQYLKSLKSVRFFLVGVANDAIELTGQHASIARDLHGIPLPPMNDEELRFILQIGSYILAPVCSFSESAMTEIVRHSSGAPYWCHFLGKALVEQEIESVGGAEPFLNRSSAATIDLGQVQQLLSALPGRSDCSIYEQQLGSIIMDDEIIKKVLHEIVKIDSNIINSSAVLRGVAQQSDVREDAAREIIEGLLQMTPSPFEVRNRIGSALSFSFRDPNFKRYIRMRIAG